MPEVAEEECPGEGVNDDSVIIELPPASLASDEPNSTALKILHIQHEHASTRTRTCTLRRWEQAVIAFG